MLSKIRLLNLFFFCIINFYSLDAFSQIKNEDELKKQANTYFEDEDYGNAYKYYSQLVSLYPKDPEYNYRIGVCMLYTEPDKKKPFSYFNIAIKNLSEAPKDALFYLGKTYHVNYKFDEAIKYYNEFKKVGSSGSIKKLQVDREIQACRNGKKLLSNLSDLVIISKKQLNEADYFRSYDIKDIGGKLLVKPDDFKSSYDKKKKEKSVVYLPKTSERVYYSSYGENGDRGRDIYFVNRLPNGSWSKPQSLPVTVNTEFDEDYPFLHPNGRTLYFSSKGHNSMGGYDVFKTTFNPETNTWSVPVNLEFPVNSPDDDILFVTDSLEKNAFFSTGRYSPYGKIDVLKINTERRPMNYAVIKGTVLKDESAQSLNSKITVKNIENGEIIGTYQAKDNGDYYMEIPNGGKFLFTVETPGLPVQSDAVQIPVAYSLKPYKQAVTYENKKLKIINYFDTPADEDSYAMMIDFIEKKAKLEINETEPYNNGLKDALKNQNQNNGNNNLNAVTSTNPTVTSDPKDNTPVTPKTNVTNEQLIDIAKNDAVEAQKEATELKQGAADAFGLATQKNAELVEIQKNIDALKNTINTTTDNNQKNSLTNQLNQLNEDAKTTQNIVTMATNMAKKLEVDAQAKQKEADLTNQYIKELEAVTKNKNNKEALAKLEQIQKELDELANQKNQSDDLYASIKAENELKQNELKKSEKKADNIKNEIQVLNNEVKDLENDLANETDNSLKENISAQIRELKNEVDIKNKELETNNQKINSLNNELNSLNEELLVAAKILNENTDNIAVTNNTPKDNKFTYNDELENNNNVNNEANPVNKNNEVATNQNNNAANTNMVANNQNADNKEPNNTNKDVVISNNQNNSNQPDNKANNNNIVNTNAPQNIDINTIIDNSIVISSPLSLDVLTQKYDDKINYDAARDGNKKEIVLQNELLKAYNQEVDKLIAIDKKQLSNTKDSEEKKKLNQEIKSLEKLKSDNANVIALNTNKIKEIDANPDLYKDNQTEVVVNKQNNNENNLNQNNNTNIESNNNNSNIAQNNNAETNNKEVNTDVNTNNNPNSNQLNAANNDGVVSQIDVNKPLSNQLVEVKNEVKQNTSELNNVISLSNSTVPNSELKQNYISKYNQLEQEQKTLLSLIEKSQNNTSIASQNPQLIEKEADKLSEEALALRKEAGAKTGTEQQELIKQAQQKEQEALAKKIELSDINQANNTNAFSLNNENIEALQKLSAGKSDNEISQANLLVDEAKLNFNQAKKLREEANGYPNGAAKLGGLTNAEEKENEAIQKQNQAIALLTKVNPNYKPKTASQPSDNMANVEAINQSISKTNQLQLETSLALSKNNQSEISNLNNQLNSSRTSEVKQLVNEASSSNNDAKQLISQSLSEPDAAKKAALLLAANKKEAETLAKLNEANKIASTSSQKDIVANNSANNENANQEQITNANKTANNNAVVENNNQNANTQKQNDANISAENNNATAINNSDLNNKANSSGVKEDIQILKEDVSKPTPIGLLNFNSYSSSEAASLKNSAVEKLNSALNTDKILQASLDKLSEEAKNASSSGNLTQADIDKLESDSEQLLKQAGQLRRIAANKTGAEKENDIQQAQNFENRAFAKKKEAANKQKQFNEATFNANAQSLKELEAMAQGKNISELANVNQKISEIEKDITQAGSMRAEANSYPTDAAKLGGYSNAEEKENEAIAKQNELIALYRKYFSNYVPKQAQVANDNSEITSKYSDVKKLVDGNYQNHIDGLTLMAQANEKEYKTRFLGLPENLSDAQQNAKSAAQTNYKKFQELNNQSSAATNLKEKKGLLIEANSYAQQAINSLNEVADMPVANVAKTPTNNNASNVNQPNNQNNSNRNQNLNNNAVVTNAGNNNVANTNRNQNAANTNATENNVNAANRTSNNTATNTNRNNTNVVKINVQGVEVKNANAYTAANPIPIDPKLPEGLVFKVQIGAFKAPLPDNTFKGLSPIIAQTTPNGYIRYLAGNFDKFESANAVKNDLRALGYSDAFVVGYYNGQRISVSEALAKLQANGQTVELVANTSAGLTENANIPRNPFPVNQNNVIPANQSVVVTNELERINGLLYTVQIGVFSKQVTKAQLYNLGPIYTEQLPSGLYRYTAGIYNQTEKLLEDKRKVVELGVRDAFVSAYYNSKRIPFAEAKRLQTENSNLKLETQNPIVFPGAVTTEPINTNANPSNVAATNNTPATNAFSNGVTSGPTPTAENGVKYEEAGITFKVQIGAYKNQVPNDVASKFLSIKTWPVSNVVINGLYIYTIGSFNGLNFAKKLKDEAVSLGITDAFITVYRDGKKLYGSEASKYLGQ